MYILGGFNSYPSTKSMSDFWSYDPVSNEWTRRADFPFEVDQCPLVAYNGKIYGFGGIIAENGVRVLTNRMWEYDPVFDRWHELETPNTYPVAGHRATVYGNKVYYFGGHLADRTFLNNMLCFEFFN